MEYISVKNAALKWEVSERYVQKYCTEGRIEGAVKFGGTWAIPEDAVKPSDMRKAASVKSPEKKPKNKPGETAEPEHPLYVAMPLICTPYRPGSALEAVIKTEDTDLRTIALAEYYYFSGHSAKASDIAEEYLTHSDIALRLSACWLYAYANLALDRIPRTRQAMIQVRQTAEAVDENTPPLYKAFSACISTGASILLHLPLAENTVPVKKYLNILPNGLRMFALYVDAHNSYLEKQYGSCIGIAETALSLESQLYPIPSIYLHLVAAMGYINMKQTEQAKDHLLKAWEIARPDDMIEAFGEHHGLLGGILEAVMKKDYPDDFKRMIDITYSFSAGWRKIHNPYTGHYVADDLTTMEFTIAMLAARGWSNKEIGSHLCVSSNTVKTYISSALQKLGITQRDDLRRFMLK